jgi:hypothetical protein
MFKAGEKATRPRESNRGPKETFGLDIKRLKQWSQDRIQQQLSTEAARQEIAVAKVRGFLDAVGKIFNPLCFYSHDFVQIYCSYYCQIAVMVENDVCKTKVFSSFSR